MLTLLDGLKRLAEVQVACDGYGSLRDPSSCGGILDTEGTSCTQTVPPGHIGHLRTQRAHLDMENTPGHGGHPWTQRALPGHRGHPWKWRAPRLRSPCSSPGVGLSGLQLPAFSRCGTSKECLASELLAPPWRHKHGTTLVSWHHHEGIVFETDIKHIARG